MTDVPDETAQDFTEVVFAALQPVIADQEPDVVIAALINVLTSVAVNGYDISEQEAIEVLTGVFSDMSEEVFEIQ